MADFNHEGHRERMRKKFLKTGFETFEPHEILEMLLFYSVPRKDTNELGHMLIKEFDTFRSVCDADINELMKIKGITENSAVLIKMIPQLAKAYMASQEKNVYLKTTKAMSEYFVNRFLGETSERVRVVCLNDKLMLINETVIAEGSPGDVRINVRKIVEFTYQNKCENIVIAHNHPNGDALPSSDDIRATREIYKILKPIGVNLIDHIVVSGNDATSLKDSGAFSMLK